MVRDDVKHLIAWPQREEDVTVDGMLRVVGAETQQVFLQKMEIVHSAEGPKPSPLYVALTQALLGSVGLMACLKAFRECDPAKAEAFTREYWALCEDGGEFGPLLWELTEAAGLDPSAITLNPASVQS